MIGLCFEDFHALAEAERESRLAKARAELRNAGGHCEVDTLAEVHSVLGDIEVLLIRQQASLGVDPVIVAGRRIR